MSGKLSSPEPGVVTGLAWTRAGGEILFIESKLIPGKSKMIITGQLGDVMKESIQIALSLVKITLSKGKQKCFDDQRPPYPCSCRCGFQKARSDQPESR